MRIAAALKGVGIAPEVRLTAAGGGSGGGGEASSRAAFASFLPSYKGGALTGHCGMTLKHGGSVHGLAVLEGGRLVSGGTSDRRLLDVFFQQLSHGNFQMKMPDIKPALLRVWDPATGESVASMEGNGWVVTALSGGCFATIEADKVAV